ncbi:MAG: ABC transporter permease subunit [Oscillospiraceae bacterium]|nr:ABC transporter permease subunit [Oscillospiraceae bacterium]
MSSIASSQKSSQGKKRTIPRQVYDEVRRYGFVYLMALPGIALFFLFNYLPMFGIIIAFKNYNHRQGIIGSPIADPWYNNFIYLFRNPNTYRTTMNTLTLNFMFMVVGTIFALLFSLSLNEIKIRIFKRTAQSISFLPYFVSWIIVSVFCYSLFSESAGALNRILVNMGREKIPWYSTPEVWPFILAIIHVWKMGGYNSVLYLASLAGIDPSYYEAARIDGANRLHMAYYISLPMLLPTILTLNLLAVGRILNADFGFFYGVIGDNALLFPTSDVLNTFIYRSLRQLGDIGMASAGGFYQSVIAAILVLITNFVANKFFDNGGLF